MKSGENLTLEEKLEKALWAANVFAKCSHKGQSVWVVEHSLIRRIVAGNSKVIKPFATIEEYQTGVQELITVKVPLTINIRYDWWEAVAIAQVLENQKYLEG